MKINGLILAAGDSSRLGQAKQLLRIDGQSLLQHIEAKLLGCLNEVFVVLGHNHQRIQRELTAAHAIINPNWQSGMGSSIACGVAAAKKGATGILLSLCDQPLIPQSHYQQLLDQFKQHPTKMTATAYAQTQGVPAIFPDSHFSQLLTLDTRYGAQKILQQPSEHTSTVQCEAAAFDLDTPQDLDHILTQLNSE